MELKIAEETSKDGFLLKRKIFNDLNFVQALRDLAKQDLPVKIAYNINKIVSRAQIYINEGQPFVKTLLDKYTEKDENGKYKMGAEDFVFTDPDAFKAEYEKFLEEDVHFHYYKININDLEGIKLSAATLGMLEPLIA